jgi:hypothetical protein
MNRRAHWISASAIAGLVMAGLVVTGAQAQVNAFRPGMAPGTPIGGVGVGPGITGQLTPINITSPYGALTTNPYANPYMNPTGSYGTPYMNPYGTNVVDPYGGYLHGAADVINSQSNFMKSREQAAIIHEQARQARLETRRKIFDQWLYEMRETPTAEQMRQVSLRNELTRSLNQPQLPEITSGKALNDILPALAGLLDRKPDTPVVPLDEEYVRRLNVTRNEGNAGNVGLLRDKGELRFPIALTRLTPPEEMTRVREQLAEFAKTAYNQALYGTVDANVVKEMESLSRRLNERLTRGINDFDFGEYSEGKRFLGSLDDAITLLKSPDAAKWINGQNVARGKSVQDLVRNMTSKGLRFAPASPGDEQVYTAVHGSMASLYNNLLAQLGAAPAGAPGTGTQP